MSTGPVTLNLTCRMCGTEVIAEFDDWTGDGPPQRAQWNCPHCDWPHEFAAIGRVVVLTGHERDSS